MCHCMMFVLLLTLGIVLCSGYETDNVNYGDQFRIRIPYKGHKLTFYTEGVYSDATILWDRSNYADIERRGNKIGNYYVINKATPRDSGRYEVKDQLGKQLSLKAFHVKAITRTIELQEKQKFSFNFELEEDSCNIKFKPHNDDIDIDIVSSGREQRRIYRGYCEELRFYPPCEIFYTEVEKSCEGHFEVHDSNNDLAWQLELIVETVYDTDTTSIVASTVIPGVIIACCCCLRRLCCKKSSKKDKPNENEPVLLRRTDLSEQSETAYPAQPNASTGPLIHNPPANVPPAYSEVPAPAVLTHAPTVHPFYASTVPPSYAPTVPPSYAPTVPPSYAPTVPVSVEPTVPPSSAPTVPVSYHPTAPLSIADTFPVSFAPTLTPSSEYEPRYELKSFTLSSYSPLSSDNTEGSVYSSDKLTFGKP